MRAIRLAVIFDQHIRMGGGYHQAITAALLANSLPEDVASVSFFTTLEENVSALARYGIEAECIRLSLLEKIRIYGRSRFVNTRLLKLIKKLEEYSPFERKLVAHKIDLVYFVSPCNLALSLEELNYITTLWDLCHRDEPEFPEVRGNGEFQERDFNYRSILPAATAIFVDSDVGKSNVVRRYGIDEERIYVIPYQPQEVIRRHKDSETSSPEGARERYGLDVPYIFYPAQFWAHKNHIYVLEGIRALERKYGLVIGAVFSGDDKGNRAYIEKCVKERGLQDRVRFLGFVSSEEIAELYLQSLALVMPTYFGPTNIPPLEAFRLGVPVLYSDRSGLRDQVGDAALVMDLKAPESMAHHLNALITDKDMRDKLVIAGRKRLDHFESVDRAAILRGVVEEFRWKRLCWE